MNYNDYDYDHCLDLCIYVCIGIAAVVSLALLVAGVVFVWGMT